jgi:cell division protein ZapA
MTDSPRVVSVEINGQRYPVKSRLEPDYVSELAAYVDEKMRVAADEMPTSDSMKVAVLAALNIADEFFRCRELDHTTYTALARRAEAIERIIDEALHVAPPGGSG